MLLYTDLIDPVDLTGYVRAALADEPINRFIFSQWLENRPIDDLDYRFVAGGEGLVEAATFRSYDTEAPLADRPGLQRISGELPPISRKLRLGEYDRLRQRNADQQIMDALYTDAERLTRQISARMELARSDALCNGSVTISENNLSAFVDFARDPSMTVVAATLWSNGGADPLNDIITWTDSYLYNPNGYGLPARAMVMTTKTWRNMSKNQNFRNSVFPNNASQPDVVTRDMANATLEAFGVPAITLYDAQVTVNGSARKVLPDGKVLFLPEAGDGELGATLWGTTAEALDPRYGLAGGDEAGIVAGIYQTDDPIAVWTKAAAIGLPILANPNLTLCATVL